MGKHEEGMTEDAGLKREAIWTIGVDHNLL